MMNYNSYQILTSRNELNSLLIVIFKACKIMKKTLGVHQGVVWGCVAPVLFLFSFRQGSAFSFITEQCFARQIMEIITPIPANGENNV